MGAAVHQVADELRPDRVLLSTPTLYFLKAIGVKTMKLILRSDGTGKLSRERDDELEIVFICGCAPDPDPCTCTVPMADEVMIACPRCNKVYTFRVADFFQNRIVQTTAEHL